MNTQELGRIVDYIFDKVKVRFPDADTEDLYSLIYKAVKRKGIKDMEYPDFMKNIKEDFIFNVKPRRSHQESTPIMTALGIGRRIKGSSSNL